MIKVCKIDGEEIVINAELIETIQATPDIIITLTTGKKILVEENIDEIIDKVISYRKNILYCPEIKE